MAEILPHQGTNTNEDFTFIVDNVSYSVNMLWNGRDESWQMRLGLSGQDYVMKTKCTVGFNLIEPYLHIEGVPQGEIYVIDEEGIFSRPDRDNTGIEKRFKLVYYSNEEVEAL